MRGIKKATTPPISNGASARPRHTRPMPQTDHLPLRVNSSTTVSIFTCRSLAHYSNTNSSYHT